MSRKINSYFKLKNDKRQNTEQASSEPVNDTEILGAQSFRTEDEVLESSSDDDIALIQNYADHQVGEYQQILRPNKAAKEVAKIVLSERRGTGSIVWDYFGTLTLRGKSIFEKYRFCKLCFEMEHTTLKGFAVSTSTSNHITHLRSVHEIELKTKNSEISLKKTTEALSGSSSSKNKKKEDEKFANARRIAEMCCSDLQAFNIVERNGFQKYISHLKPEMEFPRSRTIATTALQDVYEVYLGIVKTILNDAPKQISIVLDLWTDNYKKNAYMNIKVHYCKNFEMVSASLTTECFSHPHTGSRIADTVTSTLSKFKINDRVIHAVSDGGSNIISGLKISNILRYECMAHSLHRFLVHDILEHYEFEAIKQTVKKLKEVYKKLSYATEELASIQKAYKDDGLIDMLLQSNEIAESLQLEEEFGLSIEKVQEEGSTTLKNSNDTRWNTLLYMFRSFSKNFNAINIALIKAGKEAFIFNEMEKQLIKGFMEFLAIFEKATTYLQGRSYPTICSAIFFYENILSQLENNESVAEFGIMISLYNFTKENFNKRFKIKKINVVAALLDPCQRNWPILDNWLKKIPNNSQMDLNQVLDVEYTEGLYITKQDLIYKELLKILNDNPPAPVEHIVEQPGPSKKKPKISQLRKEMLDFVASTSTQTTSHSNISREIKTYFDAPQEDLECLEWWKKNEEYYPNLSKLANFCFGIPATSASSEEAFSVAGACITAKRSRLNPFTVKRQLFVHDNNHLVEPMLNIK